MDGLKLLGGLSVGNLIANWQINQPLRGSQHEQDFIPVCKLFCPWGAGTWLLTELEPDSTIAFGLADLGLGMPELGYVDLDELYSVTGPGGIHIEEDLYWTGNKPLSQYAADARAAGRITE